MLNKILKELVAIKKELQDIKLILKFHFLGSNYRTEVKRVNGKRVVKGHRILPDPLEDLRKEEHILQQFRKNRPAHLPKK